MALTYTPAANPQQILPDFKLKSVMGETFSAMDIPKSHAVVVMFICNHCPYVQAIEDRLIALATDFKSKNVTFVAVCSNDPAEYAEDSPEALKIRSIEKKYPFVYLLDEDQSFAKALGAVCTPDLYVFSSDRSLYYRGRLDDSWKDPAKVRKEELKLAIENLLKQQPSPETQIPSMGCSIKWKS